MLFALLSAALLIVPSDVRLTADQAALVGPHLSKVRPGYSGSAYVTDLTRENDSVTWIFQGTAGIYDVYVRYASGSDKGFSLTVDGFGVSGLLPDSSDRWSEIPVGRIELTAGKNDVVLHKGWGHFDVDSIEFKPDAVPARLLPVSAIPVTQNASPEARKLLRFLGSQYGKRTLTGQTDINECEDIHRKIGVYPAVLGTDLMDYSPSRLPFETPTPDTEQAIAAARAGQILAVHWHWNAPTHLINKMIKDANGKDLDATWKKGFYTNATTFDVAQAMNQPDSEEHKLIDRDIDAIAVQLKKYQAGHIPILFRPLHEAEGGWFWWGAKGPSACVALYRYLYHRLVVEHGLNNMIWVWNSSSPAWYPGDDVVDIMAVDAYPDDSRDSLSSTWDSLLARFNGKKMLALAEIGGVPDVDRNFKFGVKWSYFMSWGGPYGGGRLDAAELRRRYLGRHAGVVGIWK